MNQIYDSHETLDRDEAMREEVRKVARAAAAAVARLSAGERDPPGRGIRNPSPK